MEVDIEILKDLSRVPYKELCKKYNIPEEKFLTKLYSSFTGRKIKKIITKTRKNFDDFVLNIIKKRGVITRKELIKETGHRNIYPHLRKLVAAGKINILRIPYMKIPPFDKKYHQNLYYIDKEGIKKWIKRLCKKDKEKAKEVLKRLEKVGVK